MEVKNLMDASKTQAPYQFNKRHVQHLLVFINDETLNFQDSYISRLDWLENVTMDSGRSSNPTNMVTLFKAQR